MNKKVDIGSNAKVVVKWNVHQSNYTKELENSIISLTAQKYEIPEKNVSVETNYATVNNDGLHFQIALNYGGRDEIVRAAKAIAKKVKEGEILPEDITEEVISGNLSPRSRHLSSASRSFLL